MVATHDSTLTRAKDIAASVLAPTAGKNDREGHFSTEAVEALGHSGLLALILPADVGGADLGPRTFADVMTTLADADASVAMVYLMHILGAATIAAAPRNEALTKALHEIAQGRHLSTLAFSEAGSPELCWNLGDAVIRRRSVLACWSPRRRS